MNEPPEYREPARISTETKLYRALTKSGAADAVVHGRALIIDPSSGSHSSQPGYAIRQAGVEVDSGVVDMPVGTELTNRLRYLAKCLREQFNEEFDVLVVEDVPPFRFSRGRASAAGQLSLHKSIAVIESAFDVRHILRIPPQTWHTFADPAHLEAKQAGAHTDELDARAMGHAVVQIARAVMAARDAPRRRARKKSKGGARK